MKDWICAVAGVIGAAVAAAFGGWDGALTTLVIFMAVDYGTGLLVALNPPMTQTLPVTING